MRDLKEQREYNDCDGEAELILGRGGSQHDQHKSSSGPSFRGVQVRVPRTMCDH